MDCNRHSDETESADCGQIFGSVLEHDCIFFLILEHFRSLFVQIAQMGLILPRWGLILLTTPPTSSLLYSAITHSTQPQNTPFPGLNLKVGKMNCSLGKMRPIWAICTKSGHFSLLERPKGKTRRMDAGLVGQATACAKSIRSTSRLTVRYGRLTFFQAVIAFRVSVEGLYILMYLI